MPDPVPNPPRFRWLKRLGLCAVVLVVGLSLLRLYWGHRANAELDRVTEDARAKGYPVYFEDLQPTALPSHENRATHILTAMQSVPSVNAQGQTVMDTDWYIHGGADYFDEHQIPDPVTDNAAYLVQYQPVLDALRRAQQLTESDWTFGQPITRPVFNMPLIKLGECRELARSIQDAIHRAIAEDDYELAIAMLGDVLTIADSLRDVPYMLIDHLVVTSLRALAANAVQYVLPRLPNDPALDGPLESLQQRWLDEDWASTGLAEAYQAELWIVYDYVSGLIDGSYSFNTVYGYTPDHLLPMEFAPTRALLRPYYQSDLAFILRYFTLTIDAAQGFTGKAGFESRLGPEMLAIEEELENTTEVWPVRHPIAVETWWGIRAVARTTYRHLATARMCATAIAIKRYEIDHGRRPDTLDALVPRYLPTVPDDPFVADRPITYRPNGVRPVIDSYNNRYAINHVTSPEVQQRAAIAYPLLYCVGDDGNDDGGVFPIHDDDGTLRGWIQGNDQPTDWCYFLDELPKPIPDPSAVPFSQRQYGRGLGGPSLPGAVNPAPGHNVSPGSPASPGDEEEVDEPDDGGEGGEDGQPPDAPEQGQP